MQFEPNVAEMALIYQALHEAASYTRIQIRKTEYLKLAAKMKEVERSK